MLAHFVKFIKTTLYGNFLCFVDKVKKEPGTKESQKCADGGQDKKCDSSEGKEKRTEAEKKQLAKDKHGDAKEKRPGTEGTPAAARPVKVERHMKDGERLISKSLGSLGAATDTSSAPGTRSVSVLDPLNEKPIR